MECVRNFISLNLSARPQKAVKFGRRVLISEAVRSPGGRPQRGRFGASLRALKWLLLGLAKLCNVGEILASILSGSTCFWRVGLSAEQLAHRRKSSAGLEHLKCCLEPSWSSFILASFTRFTLLLLFLLGHMTSEAASDSLSLFFNALSLCGGSVCFFNFEAAAAERGAGLDAVQHRGQLPGAPSGSSRRCTAPPAGPSPAAATQLPPHLSRRRRRSSSSIRALIVFIFH